MQLGGVRYRFELLERCALRLTKLDEHLAGGSVATADRLDRYVAGAALLRRDRNRQDEDGERRYDDRHAG
jgi:hypothetical protein